MTPLLLLDAAPFCYGPAATLDAVLAELGGCDAEIALLVSGTSAEFLGGYRDRCRFVDCDTDDPAALARHDALFRRCRLFVSNTNPLSARHALTLGAPTLYLDTLFWMWDAIDPLIAAQAIYVAQDFDGVAENRARIGRSIADFRVVGPLMRAFGETGMHSDRCLVSYGGMISMLTGFETAHRYARTMTRLIVAATPGVRCAFRGNRGVMAALAAEFGAAADFAFVSHDDYIREVADAGMLLLSPGLTGCYEARAAGTPTWLLPPQNYSQQLQAATFLDALEPAFRGMHWRHIYPDFALPRYLPEAEGVARLASAIARFGTDESAQAEYVRALAGAMAGGMSTAPRRSEPARQSGAVAVAEIIRQSLAA